MAHRPEFLTSRKTCLFVLARILFVALFHVAQANKKAFIQTDTILEVFHFGDEGLLQTESDINSYHQKSLPLHRGNTRPIRFEPPMLDFHEQPVGMPKMEKVYLHNPSQEEISLISISATTAHFHASFFQNRIIHPGGNTSFDVVFLARVVGNVENTLFINTSHHGVFTYQVFGVGIPNPYRLRPFIGARVPVNSSFSPLINIHNPHSEPLQVVEMYSSGGDLHLELPTGQQGGTLNLWEIPPFETKGVMRASFSSREADNHTAFIRIKTNASDPDQFIILPVEVEVTSAPGIYSSIEMLDFGTLRSQDKPKLLNLHLLNSGTKDVQITSIRVSPSNDAVTIDFKAVTLKAAEHKYTKVASIIFDASKVQKTSQSSGKITVKAKEKSYSKLEIPYQAEVLDGYLGFDHTVTLFHIRDSVTEPVVKPIHLTNTFHFDINVHDVALPDEAHAMFKVLNFTEPVLIPPQASRYIFSLEFSPLRPSTHIDSNILLVTNASKFHLPIRAYTGFLEPLVLPPSLSERFLDFGVLSATDASSILFVVFNSNPIELVLQPWQVTGESVSVELLKTEQGNRTNVIARASEFHNITSSTHKTVILASGYYAVFRVTLLAKDLEGLYNAAIHITTDFEILTIPVKAVIAVGTLTSFPKLMVLPPSFPGKIVHQSFSIISTFSQSVRLLRIHSMSNDKRFYYRRLKTSRDELEPKRKSKVAKIYFDASLGCGDSCYVGVPFIPKSEARPPGMVMQEDMWDTDVDLFQTLSKRWAELDESQQYTAEATFEANADLQKSVETRVSAQLKWPSIIKSSDNGRLGVFFPLTSVNSSSEVEVVLENPADSPLYIQILPLAHYPNLCSVTAKLGQMFPLERLPHFSPRTLEFQVVGNQGAVPRSKAGFVEGSRMPYVYNLPLQPDEVKTLTVKFSPISNHTVTSLLMFRNNLTVLEFVVVQGSGCYESIKLGGKSPGLGGFLRFKMVESHLKECTDKSKPREPNLTLRRSFKMENTGQLQIDILSIEINGRPCEGYGFKVLNCQEFSLQPNASRDLLILFTPDFTASRVIREMKLTTAGGSQFVFSLNASLPYHMLASCSTTLPRPTWELELYVLISLTMSSMFLLVVVTAYLEALGIWDLFQKRLCFESSATSMETGKPFDLREIVRLQNSNAQSSARNSRGGGNNRSATQPLVSSSQVGLKAPEGTQSPNQITNRKARTTASKQPQQSSSSTASQQGPILLARGCSPGQEEQEYASLVEAMDKDLDRPEIIAEELESASSAQGKGAKGKVQRKPKTPKRADEGDGRPKGKAQGEEVQREDNDDSSSTTTEASYTDTEASLKEELANKKGRPLTLEKDKEEMTEHRIKAKNKKPVNTKDKSQMSSSLELPYVTPLENKRKAFTSSKSVINALASTSSANTKVLPSIPRVPRGKLDDIRPSPLSKFLAGGPRSSSSSSGSEGENNISPPPEWDCVPLCKSSSGLMDSLQQISMQTINADPFLKRPIGTPPPGSARISTCGSGSPSSYSPIEMEPKAPVGSKSKLIKSVSLPGQNGNPTFAAVAAGYDKSPGGSSSNRGGAAVCRPGLSHVSPLDSDCSDSFLSPGLLSPVENGRSPSLSNPFSAFGTSPLFNLSGVFSGITSSRSSEPRQSWPEFGRGSRPATTSTSPTSMWPSEPLEPWPRRSTTTTTTATTILGSSSLWSSSPPFSPSIWSTSVDSAPLHASFPSPPSASSFPPPGSVSTFPPTPCTTTFNLPPSVSSFPSSPSTTSFPSSPSAFPPPVSVTAFPPPPSASVFPPPPSAASSSHLADLMGCVDGRSPAPSLVARDSAGKLSPTYNPWSTWGPTFGRRSSEPWPDSSDNGN